MKNNNIKKILFYIALLPYVILLLMCIYHAIFGYEYTYIERTVYGLEAVGQILADAWALMIEAFCKPIGPLLIVWVSYQIYYFISFKSDKKEINKYSKQNKRCTSKNINIRKIVFGISILCWIIYFSLGIFAFFFGSNTGGRII